MILTVTISILIGIIWWLFFRIPRPEFPPLSVDENDPLMIEAIKTAKQHLPDFIFLFDNNKSNFQVKVPFKSSTGQIEFLWAKPLRIVETNIEVRLLTPPVTHDGKVNRVQTYALNDLIDWAVFLENGKIKGGYTMRVMFKIAKEKWGQLPDNLKAEELKYE
ncbi:MAG TPA: DUF2314 domain-containing protein [Saprospiraceae bacterium]|nr:DUF2314 domain-containing protein [Saprospiraceae bacterium]